MKIFAFTIILAVLYTPMNGSAQSSTPESNEIQVELAKENKFVVKIMSVFNRSGNKISGINDLDSFNL